MILYCQDDISSGIQFSLIIKKFNYLSQFNNFPNLGSRILQPPRADIRQLTARYFSGAYLISEFVNTS